MALDEVIEESPEVPALVEEDYTRIEIDDTGESVIGNGSPVHPTGAGSSASGFSYADNSLTKEELSKGLSGKSLLVGSTAEGGGSLGFLLNFRKAKPNDPLPYVGEYDGDIIYFDEKGRSRDGNMQIALSESAIANTGSRGDSQTRSGSGDSATFVMNSLNYREQVALKVLQAIIGHEPNPLGYDDSKIMNLVAMAFRISVEFKNRAIEFRQEETSGGGGEESGEVEVDIESLADNTEKLLYNLVNTLKEGVAIQSSTEETEDTIHIKVAIYEDLYIRFRFTNHMAYSDISVYVECNVREGETSSTRQCGFILRKGTVSVVESVDFYEKITSITSITLVAIRGKGVEDTNTYDISTETIS